MPLELRPPEAEVSRGEPRGVGREARLGSGTQGVQPEAIRTYPEAPLAFGVARPQATGKAASFSCLSTVNRELRSGQPTLQ